MRTTLDIDEDILAAARELARRRGVSAGRALSDLARQSLTGMEVGGQPDDGQVGGAVAGFMPFTGRSSPVTNELIDSLRDAQGF